MPIDLIPDSAHAPVIPLPPAPQAPKPLPRRPILKYLPLPILLIALSVSLYAVNTRTSSKSQASSACPIYDISATGELTSSNPSIKRLIQATINGTPMTLPIQVPPEGIHTWQVIDDQNCLSSGSLTPSVKILPNTNTNSYPLLIPTINPSNIPTPQAE